MDKKILERREQMFNEIVAYYEKLAEEDKRYLKTCEKLKQGKDKYMQGKTYIQVITE